MDQQFGDVAVTIDSDYVATVELQRPPNNFFDEALIRFIADAFEWLDERSECRAIVLCAEGKHFCAGANFTDGSRDAPSDPDAPHPLYSQAVRLFGTRKPVVAAIQGAAIGGGFGLAMAADFRTGSAASRFAANFVKLGFSPGFGLTHTLPRVVGQQAAQQLFFTGRRIDGVEAARLGVIDDLVEPGEERAEALYLAKQIAENAPLAVESVRASLRNDLQAAVERATAEEAREQYRLQQTEDHREGIRAVADRRPGNFSGR